MLRRSKLEWTVPETLFDEKFQKEDLLSLVKEQSVLELFRRRKVSAGYAAQLLGMAKQDFLDLVSSRKMPIISRTSSERKRHAKAVKEVLRELEAEDKKKRKRTGARSLNDKGA
jgi:predicted HTH domain antitoxin